MTWMLFIVRYRSFECLMCDNDVYYDRKVTQKQWILCFEIVFIFIDGSLCLKDFTLHMNEVKKKTESAYEIPAADKWYNNNNNISILIK